MLCGWVEEQTRFPFRTTATAANFSSLSSTSVSLLAFTIKVSKASQEPASPSLRLSKSVGLVVPGAGL